MHRHADIEQPRLVGVAEKPGHARAGRFFPIESKKPQPRKGLGRYAYWLPLPGGGLSAGAGGWPIVPAARLALASSKKAVQPGESVA